MKLKSGQLFFRSWQYRTTNGKVVYKRVCNLVICNDANDVRFVTTVEVNLDNGALGVSSILVNKNFRDDMSNIAHLHTWIKMVVDIDE